MRIYTKIRHNAEKRSRLSLFERTSLARELQKSSRESGKIAPKDLIRNRESKKEDAKRMIYFRGVHLNKYVSPLDDIRDR